MDFYNYPADTGRFHFMVIYPGLCSDTLAAANYNKIRAVYVNLETKLVDFCHQDVPKSTCGNGILDAGEACDDGNSISGDGCSSACVIEGGWMCTSSPFATRSLCQPNECGDSYINGSLPYSEVCDDGNHVSGDGCSADCKTVETGWYCGRPGHACVHVCSNSIVDYYPGPPLNLQLYQEACDDGNTVSGDGMQSNYLTMLIGCTGDCMTIEPGYECPTPGILCDKICGNGKKDGTEQCDDGNSVSGDGCSSSCIIEYKYKCNGYGPGTW